MNESILKSKDYCPTCHQVTNHQSLFLTTKSSDYDSDYHWRKHFEVIQCLGCENIHFRIRYADEEMVRYDEEGYEESYEESIYFPKYLSNHELLENIYHLSNKIRVVYIETIEALKNNCYILAGVGLRAVIEAICLDQNITGRNLEIKINNLVKNKLITEKDGSRLHSIRFLGNDSVHEMEVPREEKLRVALDIVENLMKNLFLIDIKASKHLDVVITQYDDFKSLVMRKFKSNSILQSDEKNIKELLGKDYRRIEISYMSNFTQQLIDEINNNTISSLIIGKVENNIQYFIKK